MRTTLNLDDGAIAAALKHATGKTKTQVINEALRRPMRVLVDPSTWVDFLNDQLSSQAEALAELLTGDDDVCTWQSHP